MVFFHKYSDFGGVVTMRLSDGEILLWRVQGAKSGSLNNWVCRAVGIAWVNKWLWVRGAVFYLGNTNFKHIYYMNDCLLWSDGSSTSLVIAGLEDAFCTATIPSQQVGVSLKDFLRTVVI